MIPLLCISLIREHALETWIIEYICSLEKCVVNVMGTPGQYVILCHLDECLGAWESAFVGVPCLLALAPVFVLHVT